MCGGWRCRFGIRQARGITPRGRLEFERFGLGEADRSAWITPAVHKPQQQADDRDAKDHDQDVGRSTRRADLGNAAFLERRFFVDSFIVALVAHEMASFSRVNDR